MTKVTQTINQNPVLLLHPEFWHVEDEIKISKALEGKLQTPISARHRLLIPGFRSFTTLEGVEKCINDLPHKGLLDYVKPIIDINLGIHKEKEGFKVIKIFNGYRQKGFPIIYSANTMDENKAQFNELGGDDEHFIEKLSSGSGLRGDAEILKRRIQEDLEKHANMGMPAHIPHLLVANGRDKRDHHILGAYVLSKNLVQSAEKKSALCYLLDFWTHRFNTGTYFLSLYGDVWDFDIQNTLSYDSDDFIAQLSTSEAVEGLVFQIQGKLVYICIPDFETLENAIKVVYDYIGDEDTFSNRLIDYLMAQRMLELYIKGSGPESKKIMVLATRLRYKESRIALNFGLWEAKTKGAIVHIPENTIDPSYQIMDAYYCEVEELEETEALIRLDTIEPEGESVAIFKKFNLQALHNCGIYNKYARFKLVLHQTDQGGGYLLLPTPPNVDF